MHGRSPERKVKKGCECVQVLSNRFYLKFVYINTLKDVNVIMSFNHNNDILLTTLIIFYNDVYKFINCLFTKSVIVFTINSRQYCTKVIILTF